MIDLRQKQRHGCVTWWLWFAIIVNFVVAIIYSVAMFDVADSGLALGSGLLSMLGVLNVLGSILLMRWNKTGFWLFLSSSLLGVVINIGVLNLNPAASLYSLVSILVWWGVLQIRKNGASAWSLMNKGWDYKHCRHLYQVFAGVIILLFVLSLVAFGVANRKSGSLMSDESVWEEEDVYPVGVMDSVVVDTVAVDTVAVDEEIVELEQDKMPKLAKEVIEIMGKDGMDKEEDDLADEAEQMLRSAIKDIALPMDAGVGITITQVTLEGRYLVYTAVCDENLVDIEVLRLTRDDVKKNVEEYFVDSSASDPTLGNFMDLCITAHKGVAYKYVGDTSGEECWIRFSVSDLKRLVKKIQE